MNHKIDTRLEISRVIRSKNDAQVIYDRLSSWYDILAGSERLFTDSGINKLKPVSGEKILEIGYGTGHALVEFASAVGDTGRVYGMDISEGMCAVTQRRVSHAGLASRVSLDCGDAIALPFRLGFFDAIFMSFTLELFDTPEIPLVLDECRRVLMPSGRICLVALAKEEHAGLMLKSYEWMHRRFPKVMDCRPIHVQASLEAAGFRIIDSSRKSMWGLPVDICLAANNFVKAIV